MVERSDIVHAVISYALSENALGLTRFPENIRR